jgi:Mn2+/Fe2+ NRAMP family transporter
MILGLGIGITIAFTIMTAVIDAEHVNNKEWIFNHRSRWLQRFCFFSVYCLIDFKLGLASGLLFSALFDQVFNYFTNKPFWYLGTTALWDKVISKYRWVYIFVKIFLLVFSLYLFIN